MKRCTLALARWACAVAFVTPAAGAVQPMVAAGWGHTLAVSSDGQALAWGSDNSGQLGLGRQIMQTTPQRVTGVNLGAQARAQQLGAGYYHNVAIKPDGTVWTWGDNLAGQLGDGSITANSVPSRVPGLTQFKAAGAGYSHTVALRGDGTLWSWGSNEYGELGTNRAGGSLVPVPVWGLDDIVIDAIAVGFQHNLALSDGWLLAWGDNRYGQLGDGTNTSWLAPVLIEGLPRIVAMSAGVYHSLALDASGNVWSWGSNGRGRLGDGSNVDSLRPVRLTGLPTMVAVAASAQYSMALAADGSVWAWGANDYGQLGDGSTVDRWTPVRVAGLSGVLELATRNTHSLARDASGAVWAWGYGSTGQLGDGLATDHLRPTRIPGLTGTLALAAGVGHSLAVAVDGQLMAWGENLAGQLGISAVTDRTLPSTLAGLANITQVAAAFRHSLALQSDGRVWSWGYNLGGQLGDGTIDSRTLPQRLSAPIDVVQISAGMLHSLARRRDGSVWSWGYNGDGQVGTGNLNERRNPGAVPGLSGVINLSAGLSHSLAVRSDGTVWAWGKNDDGQLGDGTTTSRTAPVQVVDLPRVVAVAGGIRHSLALTTDGTVWAWGDQTDGKLGNGANTAGAYRPGPVNGLDHVIAIAAGGGHSVALRADGTVWVWGSNVIGQLGRDDWNMDQTRPVQWQGVTQATAIAAGILHTVATRSDGTVWASGSNTEGQLGDGTYTIRYGATGVINRQFNALLDLDSTQPNLPVDSGRVPPFFVATQKAGGLRATSLQVELRGLLNPSVVRGPRAASTGYNVYVAASVPVGQQTQLFQLGATRSWSALAWPMSEYLRGVALDSQDSMVTAQILEEADLSTLGGAMIYVGFGLSADEMLSSGRYRSIFTVPR